ncbi:MAG: hypothetical protein DYG98_24475 [Haliscomenobacteraceae bacterium CHB4]|nr:hypothetical protein [Haliscomenobacteraceae bacterium CHB4]
MQSHAINRHWSGFIAFWSGYFSKKNLGNWAKPLIFRIKIWLKKFKKNLPLWDVPGIRCPNFSQVDTR